MMPLTTKSIVVPATHASVPVLEMAYREFWQSASRDLNRSVDQIWWLEFLTALAEISTNVIRYAFPPGTTPGTVSLDLALYSDRVEAQLVDRGVKFIEHPPEVDAVACDAVAVHDVEGLAESGMGLAMARAALDTLEYRRFSDGRNRWLLVKQF